MAMVHESNLLPQDALLTLFLLNALFKLSIGKADAVARIIAEIKFANQLGTKLEVAGHESASSI